MENIRIPREGNILLTGFMGSGKTTLGEYIANKFGAQYVDTDEVIKKVLEMSISEIFDENGEEYFRDMEYKICKQLCSVNGYVIATGGGTLLWKRNRDLFDNKSLIIFVDTPFEICYQRIVNTDRPIAKKKTKQELEEMYNMRKSIYKDISHVSIPGMLNNVEL